MRLQGFLHEPSVSGCLFKNCAMRLQSSESLHHPIWATLMAVTIPVRVLEPSPCLTSSADKTGLSEIHVSRSTALHHNSSNLQRHEYADLVDGAYTLFLPFRVHKPNSRGRSFSGARPKAEGLGEMGKRNSCESIPFWTASSHGIRYISRRGQGARSCEASSGLPGLTAL